MAEVVGATERVRQTDMSTPMDITWDGIRRAQTLNSEDTEVRHALADAARAGDWSRVRFILANGHENLINSTRPDGASLYAPLHQVAHIGASVDVARQLIGLGAWRTHQNARGERPVDVAARRGHQHLIEVLTPVHKRFVPHGVLLKMQCHFHEVIRGRAEKLIEEHGLRLPELEPLLEFDGDSPRFWFAVPGMYGGFAYRLDSEGVEAKLISESWCRVVEGSGERHEVTSAGSQLVAEGFV